MPAKPTHTCAKCRIRKPETAFDRGSTGRYHAYCRDCRAQIVELSPTKKCASCKKTKLRDEFDRYHTKTGKLKGWYPLCRQCRQRVADRYISHPNPDDPSGATVLIALSKGQFAIVDAADAPRVCQHRWSATPTHFHTVYAVREDNDGVRYLLHRFIIGAPDGVEVDHIDGNGLNCSRANLRTVTSLQNKLNTAMFRTNTSGFKGVTFRKDTQKWAARLSVNDRGVNLGCYDTPEEAALAYDAEVRRRYGTDGRYNFPLAGEIGIRQRDDIAA